MNEADKKELDLWSKCSGAQGAIARTLLNQEFRLNELERVWRIHATALMKDDIRLSALEGDLSAWKKGAHACSMRQIELDRRLAALERKGESAPPREEAAHNCPACAFDGALRTLDPCRSCQIASQWKPKSGTPTREERTCRSCGKFSMKSGMCTELILCKWRKTFKPMVVEGQDMWIQIPPREEVELAACPGCGGARDICLTQAPSSMGYYNKCRVCGWCGPLKGDGFNARIAWNTRADVPPKPGIPEGMKVKKFWINQSLGTVEVELNDPTTGMPLRDYLRLIGAME